MVRVFLALLLAGAAWAQQASVEGIAIDGTTKQPLSGVHIGLLLIKVDSGQTELSQNYGALSGADGRFSISSLSPGAFLLGAQRLGFVYDPAKAGSQPRPNTLALSPGEHRTDLVVEMWKRAVIAGRVLDQYGDPVQGVQVEAMPPGGDTFRSFSSPSMTNSTDERGLYRIVGAPGKYQVKASPQPVRQMNGQEIRADGSQLATYAATFYPSAEARESAALVTVGAGEDATGIDIRLAGQRSVTLKGLVTGLPARARASIYLWFGTEFQQQIRNFRFGTSEPGGKFLFSGLSPGPYTILARFDGPPNLESPLSELRLESQEADVSLAVVAGEELSGTVEMPAAAADVSPKAKFTIQLEPVSNLSRIYGGGVPSGSIDTKGNFRITSVFPGRFRVTLDPLPENGFIKSIRVDNVPAVDNVIDLTRGARGSALRISVSRNGAQIAGSIVDRAGAPVHLPLAMVMLLAGPETTAESRNASVGNGEKFILKGIRPGKYRIIALNPLNAGIGMDTSNKFWPIAEEIEVKEGDRIEKNLKIPEGVNAKP